MKIDRDKIIGSRFDRTARLVREHINEEERTVEVAFSSEAPVERFFGMEVLDHEKADFSFVKSGAAPVLKDHDPRIQTGVIESARIDPDRIGRAVLRFGKGRVAEEEFRDVVDGIRQNISVGYDITDAVVEEDEEKGGEPPVVRVAFRPLEISFVSIPADESVGVGREKETKVEKPKREVVMTTPVEVKERSPEAPKVDIQAEVHNAREKEYSRIREIQALAARHEMPEMVEESIKNGVSIEQFRGLVLDRIHTKPVKNPEATVDMTEKERGQYSLLRAINASANKDWSKAGLEREVSLELGKRYGREARGFYVPSNINWDMPGHGKRDLTVAATTGGATLKGTDQRGDLFIDALRANLVTGQLGATVITGLQGDVDIPRLNAKTTTAFMTAEGTAVTEGAPTFNQLQLAPKTVSGYVDISRRLRIQSDPSVEQIIRNDIVQQIAASIDDAALEGGQTGAPSGIIQGSSVAVVSGGTNGLAPTYAHTINLVKEVAVDNGLRGSLAYCTSPAAWAKLRQTAKVASTDSRMILEDDNMLNGYPLLQSSLCPSDLTKGSGTALSAIFFGNWNDLLIAFWSGVDIVVDSSSLSTSGGLRLAFFQDCDVGLRHDESFSVMKDAITT
jgi:HK97 family phage major capsid protein